MNPEDPLPKNHPGSPFPIRVKNASAARRELPYLPIPDNEVPSPFLDLLQSQSGSSLRSVYIHVPFCNQSCSFCMYYTCQEVSPTHIEGYVSSLISQIHIFKSFYWISGTPFSSVYLGGGTPSLLSPKDLSKILLAVRDSFPLTNDCEISIESSVDQLRKEDLLPYLDMGLNRISLGVQSFQTSLRRSLGRYSSCLDIIRKIHWIRDIGFQNICVDLIYGLPGQTLTQWQKDLEIMETLPLTGASVYPLIDLSAQTKNSPERDKNDVDKEYDFFVMADEWLQNNLHWAPSTPVQYGHPQLGQAVYVNGHGRGADVVGLGPGAGGRIHQFSWMNNPDLQSFIKTPFNFAPVFYRLSSIDPKFLELRKIFRLSEGLFLEKKIMGSSVAWWIQELDFLKNEGLAEESPDGWSLTRNGRFWAGNISFLFSKHIRNILEKKYST